MNADKLNRPMQDLRISVTDRCNFRCTYCMPLDEYTWIKRNEILSFEEIVRLAGIFAGLGVRKIRLTGGEPLVRRELDRLVASLLSIRPLMRHDEPVDLSLTTNGALLSEHATPLFLAGLRRVNISLDTLREDRFRQLTNRGELRDVFAGIEAAKRAGMAPIKLNAVLIRGINEDEVLDLVRYARANGFEMRFIEYMDVGNVNGWSLDRTVPKSEILNAIQQEFPIRELGRANGSAPAVDYEFLDGNGRLGVIGSVTEPFCSSCTRVRLTADGKLVTCLFSDTGFDLKNMLRAGASDDDLRSTIAGIWSGRVDRYSDLRWESLKSGTGYQPRDHKKIEMITLGG